MNALDKAREAPILEIIQPVVNLKKVSNRHVGLCPFYEEKTPSFNIWQESNRFYCFGCGQGGDAIDFVMQYHHLAFHEAVMKISGESLVRFRNNEVPSLPLKEIVRKFSEREPILVEVLLSDQAINNNDPWWFIRHLPDRKIFKEYGRLSNAIYALKQHLSKCNDLTS